MKTSDILIAVALAGGAAYLFSKKSSASAVTTTAKPPAPVANTFFNSIAIPAITLPDVTLDIAPESYQDVQNNFNSDMPL